MFAVQNRILEIEILRIENRNLQFQTRHSRQLMQIHMRGQESYKNKLNQTSIYQDTAIIDWQVGIVHYNP